MKKYDIIVFSLAMLLGLLMGPAEAGTLDFAVIQPGQPGTAAEAGPVMDALAGYLEKKTGLPSTIKGHYFNQLAPALAFLRASPPAWGIIQLGVYVKYATTIQMTPIAATRPGGFRKDIWRLMGRMNGDQEWRDLKGKVLGNMLFEKKSSACLLFGTPPDGLPFVLEGTFRPLRSVRSVAKGKISGVVLDRIQYETVTSMAVGKKIKVLHTSHELPTSPVVWFGTPGDEMKKIATLLQSMKDDPDAHKLLKLLQTDGFGPSDPALHKLSLDERPDACFTP